MNWETTYLMPLLGIIGVNLVLSGDNALLVALAVHRLPPHQRRPAVALGAAGAVVLHILATLVVVQLLSIPLLLGGGGLMLALIALHLLQEQGEEISPQVSPSEGLGHAVGAIIAADFVMSLDNTLAIAGMGRGHPELIMIGLLVSICVIMTSSLFVSAVMNRYPFLVTVGAGVLAWTAGRMIASDTVIRQVTWTFFKTDLKDGLFGMLLSACITVTVITAPSWRKWRTHVSGVLNEHAVVLFKLRS